MERIKLFLKMVKTKKVKIEQGIIYDALRRQYPNIPKELLNPNTKLSEILSYTGGTLEGLEIQRGNSDAGVRLYELEKRLNDLRRN